MGKETIIYLPYSGNTNKYFTNMVNTLNGRYNVISIKQALLNPIHLFRTKKIYFNHVENNKWGIKWKIAFRIIKQTHMEVNYFFHNFKQYESDNPDEAFNKVKFMVNWADNIYILSTGGRKILKDFYGVKDDNKIKYMDHINYINSYPESKRDYRQELHIPEKTLLIGLFGFLRPYKNIEMLIETFQHLKAGDNVHLLIIGSPLNKEYGDEISGLCKKNPRIHLSLERVRDEDLSSLLKALDIVVLPYDVKKNMNSGVMVAAFSYKRTVLTANTEMAKDFNRQGFIYMYDATANEKENLYQALKRVVADGKVQLHVKGQKAYEYVLTNNSPEHVLKQLES